MIWLLLLFPLSVSAGVKYDGFEDGDSRGACAVVSTANDGGPGPFGSKMLRCNQKGQNGTRGSDVGIDMEIPPGEKLVRVKFRIDKGSAHGGIHKIMKLGGAGTSQYILINDESERVWPQIADHNSKDVHKFHVEAVSNGGQLPTFWGSKGPYLTHERWHEMAIYLREGSNGALKIWMDGDLVYNNPWNTGSFPFTLLHILSNWSVNEPGDRHDGDNFSYWDELEIFTGTGGLSDNSARRDGSVSIQSSPLTKQPPPKEPTKVEQPSLPMPSNFRVDQ